VFGSTNQKREWVDQIWRVVHTCPWIEQGRRYTGQTALSKFRFRSGWIQPLLKKMLKWILAPLSALKSIFAFWGNERKHASSLDTHFFSLPRLLIRISLEDTLKIKWWTVELRLLVRWCCLVFYSWAKVFPVFSSGAAGCVWFRLDLAFDLGCPFVMIGLLYDCSLFSSISVTRQLGVLHGLHEWGAGNLISNSCRIRDARVWGVKPEFAVSIEIMILRRTLPSSHAALGSRGGLCLWLGHEII
jgi:hypothetical protein